MKLLQNLASPAENDIIYMERRKVSTEYRNSFLIKIIIHKAQVSMSISSLHDVYIDFPM
jgi:hypothetical protein